MTDIKRKMLNSVKRDMKSLGTYKKEFNRLIEIYVDLNIEYDQAMAQFEASGRQYESETAAGGTKKSAIVATMESLRKDIITYSDRLCLNPKTIEGIKIAQVAGPSKLEQALNAYAKKA